MYSRRHLLLYYYKYKDSTYAGFAVFLFLFMLVALLLTKVVLPQMYQWFSINSEVVATKKKIATIDANIAYINSLNEQDLNQKRMVFVRALPFEKDVQGILTIISSSAISSGAKLDDFSLIIGELTAKGGGSSLSSFRLTLNVTGNPFIVRKFIGYLQTRVPIVEISEIALNATSGEITLNMYYKGLPIFKVNDADPIQRISGKFDSISTLLNQWATNTDAAVSSSDTPIPTKP